MWVFLQLRVLLALALARHGRTVLVHGFNHRIRSHANGQIGTAAACNVEERLNNPR
jgi:hypothetical protein